jgi:hypothetical protein
MEARLNVINSFCEFAYGLQKLKTLNLHLFHTQQNPQHRFSTVLTKTNWYTTSCKYNDCSGLTSVTIGNSVTNIDQEAFKNCTNLTKVEISDISAWCNIAFSNGSANPMFNAHHLYINGEEIKELAIPNDVKSIGNWAFSGGTDY